MAALLIYCYAHGMFSSRQIERATYQNVAVRYLTSDLHPDHDTVAKFRRENGVLLKSLFVQILRLAQASELVKLGVIAIDGTKLKGAAAKRHTHTQAELEEQLRKLDLQISELLQQAEQADQGAESEDPDELPAALAEAQARRENWPPRRRCWPPRRRSAPGNARRSARAAPCRNAASRSRSHPRCRRATAST